MRAAMEPVDLHYAAGKLWRTALVGLVFLGLFLWVGLDSSAASGHGAGRGAALARAIGPAALRAIALGFALFTAALLFFHLRLLFGRNRLALRASHEGLTVRSYYGAQAYAWGEVETVYLKRVAVAAREQAMVKVRPRGGGRERTVAVGNLVEDSEDAAAWVETAEQLRIAAADAAQPA
jgi:hypothetical protein